MNLSIHRSALGAEVVCISVPAFPRLRANVYLIRFDGELTLLDTCSGFGEANDVLAHGLEEAASALGISSVWQALTRVLISHGHIDHIGGLPYLRQRTSAPVYVHELDRRVLTNWEERLAVISARLRTYLLESGASEEDRFTLLTMYQSYKRLYTAQPVDFTYEAEGMRVGRFEVLHTPGHCAGHVVFRLDDLLFVGDQVLSRTSPHLAPESLTANTGLGHYLDALDDLTRFAAGQASLALAGHERPIEDLPARIDEIRRHHRDRLARILEICAEPRTVAEVAAGLFGRPEGYNALLAIEEAGAHVEYLYQRGLLALENADQIEASPASQPFRYIRF